MPSSSKALMDAAAKHAAKLEAKGKQFAIQELLRIRKKGETTNGLFAFLTTEPNAEVRAVHPKAMLVILTEPDEFDVGMRAPWDETKGLQRLWDGTLRS